MADDKRIVDQDGDGYRNRLGSEVAVGIDDISAIPKGETDPVYEAKAKVLNRAIQDIGMGSAILSTSTGFTSLCCY